MKTPLRTWRLPGEDLHELHGVAQGGRKFTSAGSGARAVACTIAYSSVTPLVGEITAPIDLLLSQEVASVRSRRAQLFHMGIH